MTQFPNYTPVLNHLQEPGVKQEFPDIAELRVTPKFLSLIDDLDENTIAGGPHVVPEHMTIDSAMSPTREYAIKEFYINARIDMKHVTDADRITDIPYSNQTWQNFHTGTQCKIISQERGIVKYRYSGGDEFTYSLTEFLNNFKQVAPPPVNARKSLENFINGKLGQQDPIAVFHDPCDGIIVPAIDIDGTRIKGVVALVEEENTSGHLRIAGLLTGPVLYVEEEMRGAGLGTALVMLSLLQDRELPGWFDEVPEYSPAGIAAVRKALPHLKDISTALQTGAELPPVAEKLGLSITMDDPAPCP